MWFKNIRLYCFTQPFALSTDELEQKLAQHPFQPCHSFERARFGWVSPLGKEGDSLLHRVGDYIMLCARKDEKLLPASVVNDAVAERMDEIEAKQGRKVTRKEKQELKEDVTATLLPRAFTRSRRIYAYVALKDNLLVVNTTSATLADEFTSALRDSLGSLPVVLPDANHSPGDMMTRWLRQHKASDQFSIDQDCELFNPLEDTNVVRCRGQDLYTDEISAHLDAGKQVKKLGVVWNEALSCVLSADLTLSRLRFEDMIMERAREGDAESEAQQFDQDFAVMTLTLSPFFRALFAAFGGLREPPAEAVG